MSQAAEVPQAGMARTAGLVMATFALSNLLGLARQILISHAFGTSPQLDAFYAAEKIPNLLFNLAAGGALASAFIPSFTALLAEGDRAAAWRLASRVAQILFVVLTLVGIACGLLAPALVRAIAPGFDAAQLELTARLMRVLLVASVVFGVSGLLMGILNAHQHFLLPALAPSAYWLGMIAGILLLAPGLGVYSLAVGAVGGAVLHLLVQVPALRGRGGQFTFGLGLAEPPVRRVAGLMGPRLIGVAAVQLHWLVNTWLASGMPSGSLSAITIAWAVMTMPQVVIAQAIAIVALPTLSAQAARRQWAAMRDTLADGLRGVLFLTLPAAVGLFMLRTPIVSVLFERGAFDLRSTTMVAWALAFYCAGLIGHAVVEVLSRAFYALHDTRTPVGVGAVAMLINVASSVTLAILFVGWGWMPHGALALANSLATLLEMIALAWFLRRRLGGLGLRRWAGSLWRAALASAVMGLALTVWLRMMSSSGTWLMALGGVVLGGVTYAIVAVALRTPEARELTGIALQGWNKVRKS